MADGPDPLRFDGEAARRIEEIYATDDVVAQRRDVVAALAPAAGERVLDLGCGPGYLAAEIAGAVGEGGRVHAVDPSPSMLAVAAARRAAPGAAPVDLAAGDALAIPLPDGAVDAIVCTQVYEYVEDIPAALAEARRVLAPGGRLVVLDTDWDSVVWRSRDDARMARVLAAWDEHLAHRDLPRRTPQLLREARFAPAAARIVPILNIGFRRATYSGGMAELIADFVPGRRGVDAAEAAAWREDLVSMGDDYFFSLCRYLFTATR
jgi:ubiquinone/menaquinone biosynthesis C-methylase UbiE